MSDGSTWAADGILGTMWTQEKGQWKKTCEWCEEFPTDMELLSGRTEYVGVIYSVNCDIRLLCLTLLYELIKTVEGKI